MFITSPSPEPVDCFALSKRPLSVQNINHSPAFQPTSTRIGSLQVFKDSCKEALHQETGFEVGSEISEGTLIESSNEHLICTDHFYKDYQPFIFPQVSGIPGPVAELSRESTPYWNEDIPTSAMHPFDKMFWDDAESGILQKPLPCCSACGNQLNYPYFSSLKYYLCQGCINEARFPPNTSSYDFFQIDPPQENEGKWTNEETYQLLTIIADIGDEWQEVSARMKTKTPVQCLLHFLRLPMTDPYYISDPTKVPATDKKDSYLPFMLCEDPLATCIEFLRTVYPPLGSTLAETFQRDIESKISANSGNVQFSDIKGMMKELMEQTSIAADQFLRVELGNLFDLMVQIEQVLEGHVQTQYQQILKQIKTEQFRNHSTQPNAEP